MNLDYHSKYLKYKSKFLTLQNQIAGKINLEDILTTHLLKVLSENDIKSLRDERDRLLYLLTDDNEDETNLIFKTRIIEINNIFSCYKIFKSNAFGNAKPDSIISIEYLNKNPYSLFKINEESFNIPTNYFIELTNEMKDTIKSQEKYFDIYKNMGNIPDLSLPVLKFTEPSSKSIKTVSDEIDKEILVYKSLINFNIDKGYRIFLKGGFVHGFKLIQLLNKNPSLQAKDKIELTNRYIRDFDLSMYIPGDDAEFERKDKEFNDENVEMRKEGLKVFVYRYNNKYITSNNEAFIELSVNNGSMPYDHLSHLELPLTSMIIEFNKENIDLIFLIINEYYKISKNILLSPTEIVGLVENISKLKIVIPPSINGLFNVDKVDYNLLNIKMIDLINENVSDIYIRQFIVSHIIEPDRLFFRFFNKNIKKMKESIKLLKDCNCYQYYIKENIEWIVRDKKVIDRNIIYFLKKLNIMIKEMIKGKTIDERNFVKLLNEIQKLLFTNINLGRLNDKIHGENNINNIKNIYKLLNYLFEDIISLIFLKEPNTITRMYTVLYLKNDTHLFRLYQLYFYLHNMIAMNNFNKLN